MSVFESHQENNASSRRSFLKTSSAAVAGGALAVNFVAPKQAYAAGSDVLRVGIIGCGGRGSGATDNILTAGGDSVKIVAMADAFREGRLGTAKIS